MSAENKEETKLLPHHEQLPLCESRASYRQGRKLTAVKVYSINSESPHLLVFGVPTLDLRREVKELLMGFGKLIQFHVTKDYPAEEFTETYHACFEKIQSARIAKKMLDTKNFYGGSLHVCYAPELETLLETRAKLMQRRKDVGFRLRNLQRENTSHVVNNDSEQNVNIKQNGEHNLNVKQYGEHNVNINNYNEHYMNVKNYDEHNVTGYKYNEYNANLTNYGEHNVNNEGEHRLNESSNASIFIKENNDIVNEISDNNADLNERHKLNMGDNNLIYLNNNKRKLNKKIKTGKRLKSNVKKDISNNDSLIEKSTDIVDCTSTEKSIVSNINEALNFNKFGNEVIKKVDLKPMNKIVFNVNKKLI